MLSVLHTMWEGREKGREKGKEGREGREAEREGTEEGGRRKKEKIDAYL